MIEDDIAPALLSVPGVHEAQYDEDANSFRLTLNGGSRLWLVMHDEEPAAPVPELDELLAMDAVLKRNMYSDDASVKDVNDIVGQRRQILKQITALRAALAAHEEEPEETAGMLAALRDVAVPDIDIRP